MLNICFIFSMIDIRLWQFLFICVCLDCMNKLFCMLLLLLSEFFILMPRSCNIYSFLASISINDIMDCIGLIMPILLI